MEHDPGSFVVKLKSCLVESDGFLVLAEVPRRKSDQATGPPDAPEANAPEAMVRLREAFQSLLESKSDALKTPIAVLFTKWNRYSEIDFDQPEKEPPKLKDFLDKHSQFRDLCNSISNALVEQERDVQAFWRQAADIVETHRRGQHDSCQCASGDSSGGSLATTTSPQSTYRPGSLNLPEKKARDTIFLPASGRRFPSDAGLHDAANCAVLE